MSNLVFLNISGWAPDQVGDWLRGLDDVILPYVHYFLNAGITGKKLLFLSHHDLEKLGITKLGHQELILEAGELLSSLHHELETENVQSLALKLGCKAKSLQNQVKGLTSEMQYSMNGYNDEVSTTKFPIFVLTTVSDISVSIKNLVSWLDRTPFTGSDGYIKKRNIIVKHGMELIATAQSDNIVYTREVLMKDGLSVSEICESLIHETRDSLTIQPATLELATIRKKDEEELGMHIQSSYNGVHIIEGIKEESPADVCGKIEVGDEVIQVNYQTVVGWQLPKLVAVLKENPKEVTLTLKKRPRHGLLGSKRRNTTKLKQSTFPKSVKRNSGKGSKKSRSPLKDFLLPPPSEPFSCQDNEDTDNELDNDNEVFHTEADSLDYQLDAKHRRATVSGGSPTLKRPAINISDLTSTGRPKSHTITISSASSESETLSLGSPTSEGLGSPEVQVRVIKPEGQPIQGSGRRKHTSPLRLSPSVERKIEQKIRSAEPPKLISKKSGGAVSKVIPGDEKGSPQLVRVTRFSSKRRAELSEQERKEKEDHFSDSASDAGSVHDERPTGASSCSYTVNIIGGVPQRVPTVKDNRESPTQSPSMLLRKKHFTKKKKVPTATLR